MVGLGPSGYDNGLAAVAMVLRWLDCGAQQTHNIFITFYKGYIHVITKTFFNNIL